MTTIQNIPVDEERINQIAANAQPAIPVTGAEREKLIKRIKELLKEKNAVLVAHYYTDDDLQTLADETGGCVSDSLEMARFG